MKTLELKEMELLIGAEMSPECTRATVAVAVALVGTVVSGGLFGAFAFAVAGANWMNSCGPDDF